MSLLDQVLAAHQLANAEHTEQVQNTRIYSREVIDYRNADTLLAIIEEQFGEEFAFDPSKVLKASKNKAGQSSMIFWLHSNFPVSRTLILHRTGVFQGDGIDVHPLVVELERRLGTTAKAPKGSTPWD